MGAGRHLPVEQLFSICFGVLKQVDHTMVKQPVIPVSQQVGTVDFLWRFTHYILDITYRCRCCLVVWSPIGKIKHISVVKGLPVFLLVLMSESFGQKSGVELTAFVMGEVNPILLYMHLIGVKGN